MTACNNTDGTSPVSEACKCGNTAECGAGEYCNAETNICSTKKQPVHVYKFPITSDTCSDHGYVQINDTTTCDRAATYVGLNDNTSESNLIVLNDIALGCTQAHRSSLMFSLAEVGNAMKTVNVCVHM